MVFVRALWLCIAVSGLISPLGQAQPAPAADAFDAFLATCQQSLVHASAAAPTLASDAQSSGSVSALSNGAPAPVPSSVPRIGLWGDSHTASGHFADAMLAAWGFGDARALPASLPPALGLAGVRLPVRSQCLSPGWKLQTAHRASPNQVGFTPSLMYLSASAPALLPREIA